MIISLWNHIRIAILSFDSQHKYGWILTIESNRSYGKWMFHSSMANPSGHTQFGWQQSSDASFERQLNVYQKYKDDTNKWNANIGTVLSEHIFFSIWFRLLNPLVCLWFVEFGEKNGFIVKIPIVCVRASLFLLLCLCLCVCEM